MTPIEVEYVLHACAFILGYAIPRLCFAISDIRKGTGASNPLDPTAPRPTSGLIYTAKTVKSWLFSHISVVKLTTKRIFSNLWYTPGRSKLLYERMTKADPHIYRLRYFYYKHYRVEMWLRRLYYRCDYCGVRAFGLGLHNLFLNHSMFCNHQPRRSDERALGWPFFAESNRHRETTGDNNEI